jgi:hypothetical protein
VLVGEPIHPSGIVVEIVGTEMSCQGRSCEEHDICGEVLKEDIVVCLRKIQLKVEGKEETAIVAIWVTDRIDHCRVGFVPRHLVRHAARYDGALAQVTRVFSSDPETCDSTERRLFFKNRVLPRDDHLDLAGDYSNVMIIKYYKNEMFNSIDTTYYMT